MIVIAIILQLPLLVVVNPVHAWTADGLALKSASSSSFISSNHHHYPGRTASRPSPHGRGRTTITFFSPVVQMMLNKNSALPAMSSNKAADDDNDNAATVAAATTIAVTKMNDLLESLSLEPTDEGRRQRLARTFEEESGEQGFADLFQQQLVVFGNDIRAILMQQQQQQLQGPRSSFAEDESESSSTSSNDSQQNGFMSAEKSTEEKQLWALVDMMVQSKTLVNNKKKSISTERK
jgi:hypothetical protein